jgi:hypothetical protein
VSGGFYLYGIVGADPAAELGIELGRGASGEPLRSIESGGPLGLAVVAGESEGAPRPEPAALTAHDAVVRRLAERFPALLPARFGQWLPDEQTVIHQLAARSPELAEALAKVAGCVQMTLRVYARETAEPGELAPQAPLPETPGGGPGTRYMEQRRRERTLPEIAPLRDALRPLLRGERIERFDRIGTPGRLRATAYDLIARDAAVTYSRIVAETAPLLGSCWRVTASGPWPPYAFTPRPAA